MIAKPIDVLTHYEVRKTKSQKTEFIHAVTGFTEDLGYRVRIEKSRFGCRNIIVGNPDQADYLITAHYDTCASIGIPNFITPCSPVFFLAFQLAVVALFFVGALAVGLLVRLLTDNMVLIFGAAYIVYFAFLLLMMFGPANRHTANDNTSGVVTLLEIASTLPENMRGRVCFVLFDLEEAGLIGSAAYRKMHKSSTDRQIVLNLDCVGDGDEIIFFPVNKMKTDTNQLSMLRKICGQFGKKSIALRNKGFAFYPSDQKHFPYGVGIAAFRRGKVVGLYCDRIHTWRDTVLDHTNVNILRAALISMIDKS